MIRLKTAAARSKDLDALSGLLRIARGRAGHHETRWEAELLRVFDRLPIPIVAAVHGAKAGDALFQPV